MFKNGESERLVERNHKISSKQLKVGGILSIIWLVFLSAFVSEKESLDMIIGLGIVFLLSLYTFICGVRRRILDKRYNTYIEVLQEGSTHSIDQLAVMLGAPAPVVRKNLERMIKKKFLAHAYIDDETNTISRRTSRPQSAVKAISDSIGLNHMKYANEYIEPVLSSVVQEQEKRQRVIICGSCGARNTTIDGEHPVCEYCGNGLEE